MFIGSANGWNRLQSQRAETSDTLDLFVLMLEEFGLFGPLPDLVLC